MIADRVRPAGRSDEQPGLSWLPDGEASYATLIKRHTSLPLRAEEIHNIGLDQVERLDDEYRELGADVFGTFDLAEIYARLRDDPELHFESGPEVVEYPRTRQRTQQLDHGPLIDACARKADLEAAPFVRRDAAMVEIEWHRSDYCIRASS